MARLPIPGADDNTWGTILNDFLGVSHNNDGTLVAAELAAAGAEMTANKDQPSGYAPLDSNTLVPIANLPTGTSGTTVAIGNDTRITNAMQAGEAASGDLAGNYPNPTVAQINGVAISGTPASGEALVATGSSAAEWGTVSAGGGTPVTIAQLNSVQAMLFGNAYGFGYIPGGYQTTTSGSDPITGQPIVTVITANSNGALVVDGYTALLGDRIAVWDNNTYNSPETAGVYTVTATGDSGDPFILTRTSDSIDTGYWAAAVENSTAFGSDMSVRSAIGHGGWLLTLVGPYGYSEGTGASSGDQSHAEGRLTTARGVGSHAEGIGANAYATGQYAFSAGSIYTSNASQFTRVTASEPTQEGGQITIIDYNVGPDTLNLSGKINMAAFVTVRVVGRLSGGGAVGAWIAQGAIDSNGSTFRWVSGSSPSFTPVALDSGASGWGGPSLAIGGSGTALDVNVTGATSTSIDWTCTIELDEVA